MERIRELDGLRAIAVLMVIAWHYFGTPDGPQSSAWHLFYIGHFGVDLFFVLSGFLIATILLENRDSSNYFSAFYGRRALRILPAYYLVCAAVLVGWLSGHARGLFDGALPGWSYVLGVQNFWMAKLQTYGADALTATWSLAVEEQFYLLFPLIVWLLPQPMLEKLLWAVIFICPISRVILAFHGDQYAYYVLPQYRADVLCIGALIACWRVRGAKIDHRAAAAVFLIGLAGMVLAGFVGARDWDAAAWQHTVSAAFFGAVLFLVLAGKASRWLAPLRGRAARFFARTSYLAYLIHSLVAALVFALLHVQRTASTFSGIAVTALSFAVTFVICAMSYRFFERPLIVFGHSRFKYDAVEADVAAVAEQKS